ncbi:hypothetical protein BD413DRAFT_308846 [Trametes elegans]|nr:hypothetical protein BD413DRAFT_308846 [Trametes elegans]
MSLTSSLCPRALSALEHSPPKYSPFCSLHNPQLPLSNGTTHHGFTLARAQLRRRIHPVSCVLCIGFLLLHGVPRSVALPLWLAPQGAQVPRRGHEHPGRHYSAGRRGRLPIAQGMRRDQAQPDISAKPDHEATRRVPAWQARAGLPQPPARAST